MKTNPYCPRLAVLVALKSLAIRKQPSAISDRRDNYVRRIPRRWGGGLSTFALSGRQLSVAPLHLHRDDPAPVLQLALLYHLLGVPGYVVDPENSVADSHLPIWVSDVPHVDEAPLLLENVLNQQRLPIAEVNLDAD